jgi:methionine--tRNA ligase beta chain
MNDSKRMVRAPVKPTIDLELLKKVDVRVGTIRSVVDLEESRSLVRLAVEFGDHERTILAGLKGAARDLRELIGKQALFVVNLEPKRMFGEVSEGMLFDVGYEDGLELCLAVPEHRVPDGTRAG